MEPIQIIGIDEVEEEKQELVTELVNGYYQKIFRKLKNITSMVVHIKQHTKGGKAKKADIRVKVLAPTKIFESQESDWDLARALHKALKNMEREIEHKLHTDEQK